MELASTESRTRLQTKSWLKDLSIIGGLSFIFYFFLLWLRPVSFPDLGHDADIIRSMATNHAFVTPKLNGIKDLSNPPLYYWIASFFISLFKIQAPYFRLASAIFSSLSCCLAYATGRQLQARTSGYLAAGVLASSPLFAINAQLIAPFAVGVFFIYAALLSVLICISSNKAHYQFYGAWGFWLGAGFATLTLGLIGLLLPLAIIVLYGLIMQQIQRLRCLISPMGILLFIIITVPWFVLAARNNPHFLSYYFTSLTSYLLPAATAALSHHNWLVILSFFFGFFPWIVFLVPGTVYSWPSSWKARAEEKEAIFLLLWIAVCFAFIFITPTANRYWISLCLLPSSLIIVRFFNVAWRRYRVPMLRQCYDILFTVTSLLIVFGITMTGFNWLDLPEAAKIMTLVASLILLISLIVIFFIVRSKQNYVTFISMCVCMFILIPFVIVAQPTFIRKSIEPLVKIVLAQATKDDVIVSFNHDYPFLALQFNTPVVMVNWPNKPVYGTKYSDGSPLSVDEKTLWQQLKRGEHRFFIFTPWQQYFKLTLLHPGKLHILANTKYDVVLSNEPNEPNEPNKPNAKKD